MSVEFRIGDKVILKKDRTKATVLLSIGDRKVKIEDEYGFEYIVSRSDILPLNESTNIVSAYGRDFEVKDEDVRKKREKKTYFRKTDRGGMVKIDLHIEQITSYYHHMKNSEIVQIQMEYCKKELDQSMMKNKKSIEIVHGIGGGVLKSEVHKLLDLYNLTFFESNNGGSTEVIL